MLTPKVRAAIERQIADLTTGMEELDRLRIQENIPEWAALYEEREKLNKLLDP